MPESEDMFNVAQKVKTKLEDSGYTVVMSKSQYNEYVSLVDRGQKSIDSEADIAISIHSTEEAEGHDNMVWGQFVGGYRTDGTTTVSIEDSSSETATKSQQYANAIAAARKTSEGHDISVDNNGDLMELSFPESRGLSTYGNMAINMLVGGRGNIPWVYNEIARDGSDGSVSEEMQEKYADGIANGVKSALSTSTADSSGCSGSSSVLTAGDIASIQSVVKTYAWPDKGHSPARTPTDAYQEALNNREITSTADCGIWVGFVLRKSGYEPDYPPGGTSSQQAWLEDNWQFLGNGSDIDTSTLQTGDVAIVNQGSGGGTSGHTFIYVGEISGFDSNIASSSLGTRAPVAGSESLTEDSLGRGPLKWFRKK